MVISDPRQSPGDRVSCCFSSPTMLHHQLSTGMVSTMEMVTLFMSIELVMLSHHLIFCHPLLLFPSVFPSIRVFFNEPALTFTSGSQSIGASTTVLPVNIQIFQWVFIEVGENLSFLPPHWDNFEAWTTSSQRVSRNGEPPLQLPTLVICSTKHLWSFLPLPVSLSYFPQCFLGSPPK